MPSYARTRSSSVIAVPMLATESSLHRLKSAMRSVGTLRMWAITSTGSGTANVGTRSNSSSGSESSRRSTIASIGARSSPRRLGVKNGATVLRKRVWSGGSIVSIVGTCGQPVARIARIRSAASPLAGSPAEPKRLLNSCGSRRMGVIISCRVTRYRSVPGTWNTGAWSCIAR